MSLMFSVGVISGQDAPMSQYYSNLVVLNPAFAGTSNSDRFNFFYRNQWLGTNAGYHSFGAAYDRNLKQFNSGAALILTNEINGAYIAPTVDAIYSYRVKVGSQIWVSMGLQAGITQKYLNSASLVFNDQRETLSSGFSKVIADFAVGSIAFYKNIYGGFSVDHIAKPHQGVIKSSDSDNSRIGRRYTGFAGYVKRYNTRLISQQRILSPNIIVQIHGLQQNINWGFSFQYDKLVGGSWVRHNLQPNIDALILMAGYKTLAYKFAYSYDINIGKKTTVPLGAHEISFTMLFETSTKKKHKSIKCPTFLE